MSLGRPCPFVKSQFPKVCPNVKLSVGFQWLGFIFPGKRKQGVEWNMEHSRQKQQPEEKNEEREQSKQDKR